MQRRLNRLISLRWHYPDQVVGLRKILTLSRRLPFFYSLLLEGKNVKERLKLKKIKIIKILRSYDYDKNSNVSKVIDYCNFTEDSSNAIVRTYKYDDFGETKELGADDTENEIAILVVFMIGIRGFII